MPDDSKPYYFGGYRLLVFPNDPDRLPLLFRGDQVLHLGSRQAPLLAFIVERHGKKLTPAEVIQHVWPQKPFPDAFEDLKQVVLRLRRLLGDLMRAPHTYIDLTAGYIEFVAMVTPYPPAFIPAPRSERDSLTAKNSPPLGMGGLFLLMDEELSNGRRMSSRYSALEIAYWLNFYLLFLDNVYVPVNYLLDSNATPEILKLMRVHDSNSAMHASHRPFRILWDTSRFEAQDFPGLLAFTNEKDPWSVTLRTNEAAAATTELCKRYLTNCVILSSMAGRTHTKESIQQLRMEVFDPAENEALSPSRLARLRECLEDIVKRGDLLEKQYGYGRNLFYTIWGYSYNELQKGIERDFQPVVEEYRGYRSDFLTAIDYVSHSLKAYFASNALARQVDVIMPKEYAGVVLRPGKSELLNLYGREHNKKKYAGILLNVDAVLNLTAKQLQSLHNSAAYLDYRQAMHAVNNIAVSEIQDAHRQAIEQTFNVYLKVIEQTLRTAKASSRGTVLLSSQVAQTETGFSVQLVSETGRDRRKSGFNTNAELWGSSRKKKVVSKWVARAPIVPLPHPVRLYTDMKIYLTPT